MRAIHPSDSRRLPALLLAPLLTLLLASSCSKGEEATAQNDYCYIKTVTLGTVKRRTGTLSTSFPGSSFLMTVDQRSGMIENRDSLPYGSLLERVTATITFDGSTLSYREKGSDGGWTAYNSTDSLDLTKPLELMLRSNDDLSGRTYTLQVNVHRQEGDSLYWRQCEGEVPQLAAMTDMKAFVLDGRLAVLGSTAEGIVLARRSGTDAEGTWEEAPTSGLPATADVQTLRQQAGKLYLSTADGRILTSADAETWQQTGATHPAQLTLVEKTEEFFYAVSEGRMLRSADAQAWEEERLDSEPGLLPQTGIRALSVRQGSGNTRIVMVGENSDSRSNVVWNKMWNDSEKEADAKWVYFPLSPDNQTPCPRLAHLCLLPYDGKCIALGGASADGTHQALDVIYVSHDHGITWRHDGELHAPGKLRGTEGCIAATVDDNNFIWIITNAQVWRGRLNRLGFAQR